MVERCQVCGARWREGLLTCHECGAPKRNTILPEEPAGAPIPDAAASLATEPVPDLQAFAGESSAALPTPDGSPAPLSAEPTIPVTTNKPAALSEPAPASEDFDAPSASASHAPSAPVASPVFDTEDSSPEEIFNSGASATFDPIAEASATAPVFDTPAPAESSTANLESLAEASVASGTLSPEPAASESSEPSSAFDAALDAAASESYAALDTPSGAAPVASASSAALGDPTSSQAAASSQAAPGVPPPSVAVPSAPLPRPGGGRGPLPVILGLVLLLAVGGGVAFYFLREQAPPSTDSTDPQEPISIAAPNVMDDAPSCDDLEKLEGSWVFTTATTNARKETRIGMRGFFEMQVEVSDCKATASLVKVGRKGKPNFAPHKRPKATATLTANKTGLYTFGFGAVFALQNEDGQGVPLQITFARDGEQLVGAWRQVGPRWETSGMYGVLNGEREGDPRKLRVRRSEMPCAIQCAAPPELAEVDDPTLDNIAACRAACG